MLLHGKKLIRKTPRTAGTEYTAPTYARPLTILLASWTPVKIVTISITPFTHPNRVVWRFVNPNEETMIWV